MKSRCLNPNGRQFEYYSTRGVCERWLAYENFRQDMFEPFLKHAQEHGFHETTLDRKSNSLGYSKENCRWATWEVQFKNMDLPPAKQLKIDFYNYGIAPITEEEWKELLLIA